MKKKIISLLLAIVMVCSLLPTTALAVQAESPETAEVGDTFVGKDGKTYTRLEYAENDGVHYIETGYVPTAVTRSEVDYQLVELGGTNIGVYGCYSGNASSLNDRHQIMSSTAGKITYGLGAGNYKTDRDTDRHTVVLDNKAAAVTVDNVPQESSSGSAFSGVAGTRTIKLFANQSTNTNDISVSHSKFFSVKIYEDYEDSSSEPVRSFIPASITENGYLTTGMYETVNGVFYPLISSPTSADGLEDVDYIESDGAAYFITGYIPTAVTRSEVDYQLAELGSTNIGVYGVNKTDKARHQIMSMTEGKITYGLGAGSYKTDRDTGRHTVILDNKAAAVTVDNVAQESTSGKAFSGVAETGSIYLFAANITSTYYKSHSRLFSVKIYEDDVLARNFVPKHDPINDEYGFWETVEGKWYTAAGLTGGMYVPETYRFEDEDSGAAISFSDDFLTANGGELASDVAFTAVKQEELPSGVVVNDTENAVVYDVNMTIKGEAVTTFQGEETATLEIPFVLPEGKTAADFGVFNFKTDGSKEAVPSTYNEETGCYEAEISHLSYYGVDGSAVVYTVSVPEDDYQTGNNFAAPVTATVDSETGYEFGYFEFTVDVPTGLTLTGVTTDLSGYTVQFNEENNKANILLMSATPIEITSEAGVEIAELAFTVNSDAVNGESVDVGLSEGKYIFADDNVLFDAGLVSDSVTLYAGSITLTATVDGDGGTVTPESVTVDLDAQGEYEYLGTEFTVIPAPGYELDTENTDLPEVGDKLTASADYTVKFKDASYAVTGDGYAEPDEATHGTDFTVNLNAPEGKIITGVTATIENNEDSPIALTADANGDYIISGSDIVGAIEIAYTTIEAEWELVTKEDYTVLTTGTQIAILKTDKLASGTFKLGDNDMFWSSEYEGYVYIVDAAETAATLSAKLGTSANEVYEIKYTGDVDGSGSVTGSDVVPVTARLFGRTVKYTITDKMLLEMDVTGDKAVTAQDVTFIMRVAIGLPGEVEDN